MIRPFVNRQKVSEKSNVRISGLQYSDGYCLYTTLFGTASVYKWEFEWSKLICSSNGLPRIATVIKNARTMGAN